MINTIEDLIEISTKNSDTLYLLDFNATWCNPCKKIKPFINELNDNYPSVEVLYLDIDEDDNSDIVEHFNITALPTFIYFKNGKKTGSVLGIDQTNIEDTLNDCL